MFKTQRQYSIAHRVLGLGIPIFIMIFFSSASWAFPIAATCLCLGFILLFIKIRFQWRDYQAFKMLSSPAYGLDHYDVSGRVFFIDDLAIESFIYMAAEKGLKLQIHADNNKAKVNKTHLPCYRRGSDTF
jgi:hypothetical protein